MFSNNVVSALNVTGTVTAAVVSTTGNVVATANVNGFDTWTLSSFEVPSNIKMAIFSEVNYGGLYRILTQTTPSFQSLNTSGLNWNDNVRSIKIMYATENIGKPYEAYVYNSAVDLAITAESVYTDGNGKQRIRWLGGGSYNVYDIVSYLGTSSLSTYILFGTGVTNNSTVYQTLSGVASNGTTPCYEFVIEGSISTDITKTFYIRNGKTQFDTLYSLMETIIDSTNPPTQPSSLSSSSITSSAFTVGWSGGNGATSYTYTLNGVAATPSANNGVASKSATFSGLTSDTTYSVVVTAAKGSLTSSSSSLSVKTTVPGSIVWQGGQNVTLTGTTTIQKTGGVNGAQDAGQNSFPLFTGTKFLQFSATSLIDAQIGIGQYGVLTENYGFDNTTAFDMAIRLLSTGEIATVNGEQGYSEGVGLYNSSTMFGIMKDFVTNEVVFFVNNVQVKRYSYYNISNGNIVNVSIKTSGGTINNIQLLDERPT